MQDPSLHLGFPPTSVAGYAGPSSSLQTTPEVPDGVVTPGETLGTRYTFGVGSDKTKQHSDSAGSVCVSKLREREHLPA